MKRSIFLWLLGAFWGGVLPATAGAPSPLAWSPRGEWLAFEATLPVHETAIRTGWLFDANGLGRTGFLSEPTELALPRLEHRLLLAHARTGECVELMRTMSPLSAPAWSPDGRALAVVRVTTDPAGHSRADLVLQSSRENSRVLVSQAFEGASLPAEVLATLEPQWSPDGRYITAPIPRVGHALAVVRADNGRVIKMLDQVVWGIWSPDGAKLAVVRAGANATLELMDLGFGPSRHLVEIGQPLHPPVWSTDGQSLLTASRRIVRTGSNETREFQILRVGIDSGVVEPVSLLSAESDESVQGVAFTMDPDADEIFSVVDQTREPATIVWYRPATRETLSRFHPIDVALRVSGLALAPGGKTLAVRLGPGNDGPFVALWEVDSSRATSLIPNAQVRRAWLRLLVSTSSQLLKAGLPIASVEGRPVERATILPIPGEIPASQELAFRLRVLAKLGRRLQNEHAGDPLAGNVQDDPFEIESRVFFDVLSDDYVTAITDIERLESRSSKPDERLRLLSLRAQCYLGLGDAERARESVRFLNELEERGPFRVESTIAGISLAREPGPTRGWASYFAGRFEGAIKAFQGESEPAYRSLGNRNPDAPLPDLPIGIMNPLNVRP